MKRSVFYASLLFVCLIGCIHASAQCVEITAGPAGPAIPIPTPTPGGNNYQKYTIDNKTSFKVTSGGAMTTAYDRTNDYMVFEVAQNVYATNATGNLRCIVIPKGTQVYGKVDYAHRRSFMNFNGKARIMVYVDSLQTETGQTINVEFNELRSNYKSRHAIVRPCKNDAGKQCITGRRTRGDFVPGIGSATTKGFEENAKADSTKGSVTLAGFDALLSSSGLNSFITRPEASIKGGQVYDVRVVGTTDFWIRLPDAPKY